MRIFWKRLAISVGIVTTINIVSLVLVKTLNIPQDFSMTFFYSIVIMELLERLMKNDKPYKWKCPVLHCNFSLESSEKGMAESLSAKHLLRHGDNTLPPFPKQRNSW